MGNADDSGSENNLCGQSGKIVQNRSGPVKPPEWSGGIVAELHMNGITAKELAKEANLNDKYVSTILNGKRTSKQAEEKIKSALERLKSENEELPDD